MTVDSIRNYLPSKYQDIHVHIFDTIDSTNTYARTLVDAPHGTVIIARQQTGGKGRLGRSFHSPEDGIYMSIIIKPDFDPGKMTLVTPAAAVAVCNAISSVCNQNAAIKWVNDIYIDNLKVCGILTEGVTDYETGTISSIVIGIGINTDVNNFPEELSTIAGAVTGDYVKSELAAAVITETLELIEAIEDKNLINKYKEKSLVLGKNVQVFKGAYKKSPEEDLPSRSAKVLDIDENGGLVVIYSDGTRETLFTGEITVRI